jgi:uncharacterized membrane protein YcaP (DUF421 family)
MLSEWIGTDPQHIVWWQMCIRAVIVFLFGLAVIRVFGRKAFGKQSSVDIVLAIVIGSNLSRTLTANAPLGPTLCATFVLVLCFWSFGHIAARWPAFGRIVKGDPVTLMRDGSLDRKRMGRAGVSEGDVAEAARRSGLPDLAHVRDAVLERSGEISTLGRH